jgi:osmotically-inducible protein OsmY
MTIPIRTVVACAAAVALSSLPALAQSTPKNGSTVTFRGLTGSQRIVPDNPPSDAVLATHVREALANDPYLSGEHIGVEVVRGVALLSNDVPTLFQRSRAEIVADRVPDIVGVISRIGVSSPEYGKHQTDDELLADIRDEIYWNPEINLDDVHVSVDHGVATLTGAVDSYRTRGAAQDEALSAGAVDVVNRITVRRSYAPTGTPSQGS